MRKTGPWIAFLAMLFATVGLCGLFGTYAVSIPLERALARGAMLDELLAAPDPTARLRELGPRLGSLEAPLAAPGTLPARVAAARAVVAEEQRRESASLSYRVRLMLVILTVIAACLGGGIVALMGRQAG